MALRAIDEHMMEERPVSGDGFERIRLLFRRTNCLPQLRGTALKLIQAIDNTDASAAALESIISTDPGLTTSLLRVSNGAMAGFDTPVTSIRSAIMRLGHRAIRSLAVSLTVQDVLLCSKPTRSFNMDRFARHSLFVGLLSRYLYARQQKLAAFESQWSADEILAAGVLHDLAAPLIATFAGEAYDRSYVFAQRRGCPIPTAFSTIFATSMGSLAADACEAWSLPEMFGKCLRNIDSPWSLPEEFMSVSSINYANHIAVIKGFGTEDWEMESVLAPEVAEEFQLGDEELDFVIAGVDRHVTELLEATKSEAA